MGKGYVCALLPLPIDGVSGVEFSTPSSPFCSTLASMTTMDHHSDSPSPPQISSPTSDCGFQPLVSHLSASPSSVHRSGANPPAQPFQSRADEWWTLSDKRADDALSQHALLSSAVLSSSVFLLGLVLSGTLTQLPVAEPSIDVSRLMAVLLLLFAAVFAGLFMMTVTWIPYFFLWRWSSGLKLQEAEAATSPHAASAERLRMQHERREENRRRREMVLQANNVLFSLLLVLAIGLQVVAVVFLIVSVMCESIAFQGYERCHDDSLIALCCMVGAWMLIAALTALISLCAARRTALHITSVRGNSVR